MYKARLGSLLIIGGDADGDLEGRMLRLREVGELLRIKALS